MAAARFVPCPRQRKASEHAAAAVVVVVTFALPYDEEVKLSSSWSVSMEKRDRSAHNSPTAVTLLRGQIRGEKGLEGTSSSTNQRGRWNGDPTVA